MQIIREYLKGDFLISTDQLKTDLVAVHEYLHHHSYWAKGIPMETFKRSLENSIAFSIFHKEKQVGFARVVTDQAVFAYLADVFVLNEYRKQGLSKWLMECIMTFPELQGLRRWMLATRDAHGLYKKYGFTAVSKPESLMEIVHPDMYLKNQ